MFYSKAFFKKLAKFQIILALLFSLSAFAAQNDWDKDKRYVESNVEQNKKNVKALDEQIKDLEVKIIEIQQQNSLQTMAVGALSGMAPTITALLFIWIQSKRKNGKSSE
jgi:hypothetical protein